MLYFIYSFIPQAFTEHSFFLGPGMNTGDTDSAYSILVTILVTGVLAVNSRQKRGKVSFLTKIKY